MESTLRRRLGGDDAAAPAPTSAHDDAPTAEEVRLAPVSKIAPRRQRQTRRRSSLIFLLGGLFGLLLAGFFAQSNDLIEFPELGELHMESLMGVLPAGLVQDAQDLTQTQRDAANWDAFAVGMSLQAQGVHAKHPVVMVPGVISTGLESWGTSKASQPYFRKRLWGSWSMMRALMMDKEEWKRHVMLDKTTGLDPPDIKLRAAQGFDAADFFITGYWIWNKILENLASIGYDPTNSYTAAYDWRLSYQNLEVRDQYFTRLKTYIEIAVKATGQKAVIASHSMGSQVLFYFFHWVASPEGGNGGDDWVDTWIDSWINISGCMLGALKDITALTSGEMRDTAQLNTVAVYGLEKFLGKEERAEIFRAMPGISSMLPMGGNAVWGDQEGAPDDLPGQATTFGSFFNFKPANGSVKANWTVEDAMDYLLSSAEPWYRDQVLGSYSHGVALTKEQVDANEKDNRKWTNPLESRLPLAPNLKIYCFYGVGKPTERGYFYHHPEESLPGLNITIDTSVTEGEIDRGVKMGEGDGTVNLLSVAYMCNKGWHMPRYNPAGSKITVYEMPHEPDRFNPRGGPNTGDHVDILGRQNLNELILRIAGGRGDDIEDFVVSNIKEYADKVKIPA